MSALAFESQNIAVVKPHVDWGAIWVGVFTFIGIWSVFGLLGTAIFSSAANPAAAHPISGMGVGMGIWAIVLTIIAMYVAGLETGRLAAVTNRHDGLIHGLAMFGLSVAATLVIVSLGETAMSTGVSTTAHSSYLLSLASGLGWAGFIALFLGWLAAMGGASSGVQRKIQTERPVQQFRNAA